LLSFPTTGAAVPGDGAKREGARPGLKLRLLLGDMIAMGPGKADLLEAIRETGSISAAGRKLGIGYRRAWALVDAMNQCFRQPLVEGSAGGAKGGGAKVTPSGEEVLRTFRAIQAKAGKAVEAELARLEGLAARTKKG
jgi:molybdate transport system regulatory protein